MINVKVYIEAENSFKFLDDNVSVAFKLPAIPRVGERIFLSDELQTQLEKMATSSLEIAENYREWFYGFSSGLQNNDEDVNETNLKDLSFGDASVVSHVVFKPNDDTVYIELGRF
jgi:hypothetical protein